MDVMIRIYSLGGRQVAELALSEMVRDGWDWDGFVEAQGIGGRTCVMVVEGGDEGASDQ